MLALRYLTSALRYRNFLKYDILLRYCIPIGNYYVIQDSYPHTNTMMTMYAWLDEYLSPSLPLRFNNAHMSSSPLLDLIDFLKSVASNFKFGRSVLGLVTSTCTLSTHTLTLLLTRTQWHCLDASLFHYLSDVASWMSIELQLTYSCFFSLSSPGYEFPYYLG